MTPVTRHDAGAVDTLDQFGRRGRRCPSSWPRPLARPRRRRSPGCRRPTTIDHVVVLGMGGSGIAGDVLAAVAAPLSPVPIVVVEGLRAARASSAHARSCWRVSCSGQHRGDARGGDRGGSHAGARRGRVARAARWPTLAGRVGRAAHRRRRPTSSMPRSGHRRARRCRCSSVLEEVGLLPGRPPVRRATPSPSCAAGATSWSRPGNAAEVLARRIGRTIPLVYGGGPIGAVAAMRWKCQVNENAKAPAFANRLPELCHNEAAGWGQHGDVTRQVLTLVQLRHDFETREVAARFALVDDQMLEVVGRHPPWRPTATARWPSCSTWCSWATSRRCTWPPTPASTPARSPPSDSMQGRPAALVPTRRCVATLDGEPGRRNRGQRCRRRH